MKKSNNNKNKDSIFSEVSVLIHNCQGYEAKKDYHKNLIKRFKPTFGTWSEIQMREVEAMSLQDDIDGYKTISQTPDMFMRDVEERINWRPKQGASIFYEESWADRLVEVKIARRAAIATYKVNNMYLMYIGAYLPTNSNNNENFKKSLDEVKKHIVAARKKYKHFSFIMAGDLNIDRKHSKERKKIFETYK